jgi:hypothetical protein
MFNRLVIRHITGEANITIVRSEAELTYCPNISRTKPICSEAQTDALDYLQQVRGVMRSAL